MSLSKEEKAARRRAIKKSWRDRNIEKVRAQKRAAYRRQGKRNAETARNLAIRGWSFSKIDEAICAQNLECAICSVILHYGGSQQNNSLQTDHCHYNGLPRGLLCHRCNLGIGSFKDDPDLLIAAADYVEWHDENPTLFPSETGNHGYQKTLYRIIGYTPQEAGNMHMQKWSPQLFEIRYADQNQRCAVCINNLNVNDCYLDHNHYNGLPRGVLCMFCNTGIGKLGDDPFVIRRASDYLFRFKLGVAI